MLVRITHNSYKNMNKQLTYSLLFLAIVLLGAGALLYSKNTAPQNLTAAQPETSATQTAITPTPGRTLNPILPVASEPNVSLQEATIMLSDKGFTPSSITIKKGDTVTWINNTSGNMWVASAMHPTHTAYDGTTLQQHCPNTAGGAFDECATGNTFTFTFDKVGTWKYHNHVDPSKYGSVTVTE